MKKFVSHKVVEASKITAEETTQHADKINLTLEDGTVEGVFTEWFKIHTKDGEHSLVGGYLVKYADNYTSWSPAEAFEGGYTEVPEGKTATPVHRVGYASVPQALIKPNTFPGALVVLKSGKKVARKGWNGKGMYVFLVDGSKFTVNRPPLDKMFEAGTEIEYRPHIDMLAVDGTIGVWNPSMSDLLAEDWVVVE